jgi:hypothetical protein
VCVCALVRSRHALHQSVIESYTLSQASIMNRCAARLSVRLSFRPNGRERDRVPPTDRQFPIARRALRLLRSVGKAACTAGGSVGSIAARYESGDSSSTALRDESDAV